MIVALKKNLNVDREKKLFKDDEGQLLGITRDGDKDMEYYHVHFPKIGRVKIESDLMYIVKSRE